MDGRGRAGAGVEGGRGGGVCEAWGGDGRRREEKGGVRGVSGCGRSARGAMSEAQLGLCTHGG